MTTDTIAFIGAGNMATSLIGGLIANGRPGDSIRASDPDEEKLAELSRTFGVGTAGDNDSVIAEADTVVLAVKPQVMEDVIRAGAGTIESRSPLLVSIAAGVREASIAAWLGFDAAVVRCMPNTPALVQAGATALYANRQVTRAQRDQAEAILRAVGLTVWVEDERQLDAVTAVSGSGPAYYFLLMELMEETAVKLGLERDAARSLVLQTALGAATMAIDSSDSPATLRSRVTSPGGTTEAAIDSFLNSDLAGTVERALTAAFDRSVELGAPPEES